MNFTFWELLFIRTFYRITMNKVFRRRPDSEKAGGERGAGGGWGVGGGGDERGRKMRIKRTRRKEMIERGNGKERQ